MRLGYAAGQVLAHEASGSNRPTVLIGKDTRLSGYMLEAALEAGFSAAGVDVMLAGPMPTPAIAYLTRALRLSAGVVISASHNPYHDNGIKFFSASGNKLPDTVELAIETALESPLSCVSSEKLGKARRLDDARGRYIEFCKSTFPNELDLRGLKLVVDCAHGAAYHIAPDVFHELGAEIIAIGNQPNGLNINDGVGATQPEALARAVDEHGADLGIALDGDADRLLMVDGSGRVYNGDELLYLMVRDRHQNGGIDGAVGTLMTNMAVESAFRAMGVGFARAKVGDRYVLETLLERGWQVGGEGSGVKTRGETGHFGRGLERGKRLADKRQGQPGARLESRLAHGGRRHPGAGVCLPVRSGGGRAQHLRPEQLPAQPGLRDSLGQPADVLVRSQFRLPDAERAILPRQQGAVSGRE